MIEHRVIDTYDCIFVLLDVMVLKFERRYGLVSTVDEVDRNHITCESARNIWHGRELDSNFLQAHSSPLEQVRLRNQVFSVDGELDEFVNAGHIDLVSI